MATIRQFPSDVPLANTPFPYNNFGRDDGYLDDANARVEPILATTSALAGINVRLNDSFCGSGCEIRSHS